MGFGVVCMTTGVGSGLAGGPAAGSGAHAMTRASRTATALLRKELMAADLDYELLRVRPVGRGLDDLGVVVQDRSPY